jgi:hypothetical protein
VAQAGPRVRADVLLCDSAQEIGGKLYILGGGWSRIAALNPNLPISFAIAVKLRIPWHDANRRLALRLALFTEDNQPVLLPDGTDVHAEGNIEVGRPPGLRPGSDLDSAFVVPVNAQLAPGAYHWDLAIDGQLIEVVPFEVLPAPPGLAFPGQQRRP